MNLDEAIAMAKKYIEAHNTLNDLITADDAGDAVDAAADALVEMQMLFDLPAILDAMEQAKERERYAIGVLAKWDRVYEELGSPGQLGCSMSDAALAEVKSLKVRIAELEKVVGAAKYWKACRNNNGPGLCTDDECDCGKMFYESEQSLVAALAALDKEASHETP